MTKGEFIFFWFCATIVASCAAYLAHEKMYYISGFFMCFSVMLTIVLTQQLWIKK